MQAVQALLRCPGVDVNVQDAANYGYTPLINAARNGDRQMVQVRVIVVIVVVEKIPKDIQN